MHGKLKSNALLVTALAIASTAVVAQNPGQGQGQQPGQGQGQGQQQPAQQRQMERAADQSRTAEQTRLQQRERDRTQQAADTAKASKPVATKDGIYGGNLMTDQERMQYRERLGALEGEQARNEYLNQHREEMQQRSRQRGIPIEVTTD